MKPETGKLLEKAERALQAAEALLREGVAISRRGGLAMPCFTRLGSFLMQGNLLCKPWLGRRASDLRVCPRLASVQVSERLSDRPAQQAADD